MRRSCSAVVLFLLFMICAWRAEAQRNTTPGLPYTYVVQDSIPEYARGPAWDSLETRIRSYYGSLDSQYNEIRYIYRIHCHPALTAISSEDSITIQLPRNPGEAELITLGKANKYQRIAQIGSHVFESGWVVSGFQSFQRGELRSASFLLSESDDTKASPPSPDSSYFGELKFIPSRYEIFPGLRGSNADAYAYLIQFVDPVWAPRVLKTKESLPIELSVRAYPNPAKTEVNLELPEDWGVVPLTIRIYGPEGKLLSRSAYSPAQLQRVALDATWPEGLYQFLIIRDGGRMAIARIMKARP